MKFTILPKFFAVENKEADSAENALIDFATGMDMNNYFKAIPTAGESNVVAADIANLINSTKFTADECSDIFRALTKQEQVLGGKLWTTNDIRSMVFDDFGGDLIDYSDDDIDTIAGYVNEDVFTECTDGEWCAIHDGIVNSCISVHVTDIEWDVDKEDFDDEAEYRAVLENELPVDIDVPIKALGGDGDIETWLSDQFGYCVNSYVIEKKD